MKKTRQKITSAVIALIMVLAVFAGTLTPASADNAQSDVWDGDAVDISWYNASETTFDISTASELAGLAAIVNGDADGIAKDDFAGKTVKLTGDINLDDSNTKYASAEGKFGDSSYAMVTTYYTVEPSANIWTPIGSDSGDVTNNKPVSPNYFSGTFDGGGHTVNGLYTDGKSSVQGLFGCVKGSIQNTTVEGLVSGKYVVGGIVAYLSGGTVQSCVNNAVVFSDGSEVADSNAITGISKGGAVGGIVGAMTGTAENPSTVKLCENNKNVTCANVNKGGRVGGIVGLVDAATDVGSVSKSVNHGEIDAYQYAGGIVGYNEAKAVPITECGNTGSTTVHSPGTLYAGGIVAKTQGNVTDCYNTGTYTAQIDGSAGKASTLGGIIGSNQASKADTKITNCYSTGSIAMAGNTTSVSTVGLISGFTENKDQLLNCYYLDTARNENNSNDILLGYLSEDNARTADAMKSKEFVQEINGEGNSFAVDDENMNDGYPVLAFQSKSRETIDAVTQYIDAIGTVTLDKKDDIKKAREAYDALTDSQKAAVDNLDILEAAEKALAKLQLGKQAGIKVVSTTYESATISWRKNAEAEGYLVYRATSKAGKYTQVNKGTQVSFKDIKLKTGSTYCYKVAAYKTVNGEMVLGIQSDIESIKPILKKPVLKLKAGKKQATIHWSKISGASGYQIYRSTKSKSGFKTVKTITKGTTVKYINKKLKKGKNYCYKVRAYRVVSGKKVYSSASAVKRVKVK